MSNFYGLIGEKLGHSLSPKIHENILKMLELPGNYSLFEIKHQDLETAVKGLKALGCRGANVTIPYKIDIMGFLDKISKEAERIEAVNTIAFGPEGLTGYNTDYFGFGCTLRRASIDISGRKVVLMGPGGAARAVLQYLLDNNASEITFVSRDPHRASKKVKGHEIISYTELKNMDDKDILINCTPCGMYPIMDAAPVNLEVIKKFSVVVDLIYNPRETVLLKAAREAGLVTANGLFMLVAQAAAAQEIWQGEKFSAEFLEKIYISVKGGL